MVQQSHFILLATLKSISLWKIIQPFCWCDKKFWASTRKMFWHNRPKETQKTNPLLRVGFEILWKNSRRIRRPDSRVQRRFIRSERKIQQNYRGRNRRGRKCLNGTITKNYSQSILRKCQSRFRCSRLRAWLKKRLRS